MNENNGAPDKEQGLYRKYEVKRLNDPTGKHAQCTYYILDLDHDPHSVAALEAYAASCKDQYPTLAFDLRHAAAATARKLCVAPRPAPLGYTLVSLELLNDLTERIADLAEAGSADAQSLAADAALLLQPKGETT